MSRVLEPQPFTPLDPVTEVMHGVEITDPYRWLEDQGSSRTRQWIAEQTAYTRPYLDAIPGRDHIRQRVEELLAIEVTSEPWAVGNRCFFLKRLRNHQQSSILMKDRPAGDRALVAPSRRPTGSS